MRVNQIEWISKHVSFITTRHQIKDYDSPNEGAVYYTIDVYEGVLKKFSRHQLSKQLGHEEKVYKCDVLLKGAVINFKNVFVAPNEQSTFYYSLDRCINDAIEKSFKHYKENVNWKNIIGEDGWIR